MNCFAAFSDQVVVVLCEPLLGKLAKSCLLYSCNFLKGWSISLHFVFHQWELHIKCHSFTDELLSHGDHCLLLNITEHDKNSVRSARTEICFLGCVLLIAWSTFCGILFSSMAGNCDLLEPGKTKWWLLFRF